ncbi:MAG: DNA repair protein RecO [Ruminococcus sp.]|nr:DNA repair protein RecO [Ruminococcus sp.]
MITAEGIVLKERSVGEQDKFIDILTKESGVLEVSVKGARKINGKSGSSTQLFAYSRFCMNKRGERFYLNSAEPIHIFYDLRSSLTRLSLASYFAEVLRFCTVPEARNNDILRLFLNTLHFLEKGLREEKLLKVVFELRLMSEIGYMPDIVACRDCGLYEPEELFFCIDDGGFYCAECFGGSEDNNYLKMKLPVLNAVRHIVLADFDRLFNFRASEKTMQTLAAAAESYLISHLERSFRTLDFYKSL